MASTDRRLIRNVIARLVGLGKNIRYIYTHLKMDTKFKFTPNSVIQRIVDATRLMFARGRAVNRLARDETIGSIFGRDKKARPTRICVDYTFNHTYGGKVARGSTATSKELGSIELFSNTTKAEMTKYILSHIQGWLDKHYEHSNRREISSSLSITSLQEC